MRSRVLLSLLACIIFTPSPALAHVGQTDPESQESLQLDEKVTVTANRLEQPLHEVGSSVTVVTREEIEASGAHWLMDVLARVPGLSVARTGGPGATTTLFTRGTNSNHTLVLLNGVKANAPVTGAFDWAYVPASSVERVEIIRGPQSTLYGSEAIGGVVNIITRSAGGAPRADVSLDAGSYATTRLAGGLRGGGQRGRYAVGLDYLDSDNFSAADQANGNLEADAFSNLSLDGRAGYRFGSGLDIEGFATWSEGRTRFDGFDFALGPIDDPAATTDASSLIAGLRGRHAVGKWSGSLTASTSLNRLSTATPEGFNTESLVDTSITELDLQNDIAFDASNLSTVGVEYRSERALSSARSPFGSSGFDERIDILGVYAQHRLRLGDSLHLTGGVRAEDHEKFGRHTTYRFTGAFAPAAALRIHASVGTGFRAPNFNELYFPGFGNPTLGPEESTGWDVGAGGSWHGGRLEADVTYFHNDLSGLIEFTFPAGFVNLGEARSKGVEVTAGGLPHRLVRLDASYTFTDASTAGSADQLLRRPRHQAVLMMRLTPGPGIDLFTELRYKGARNDFGTVGIVELPAYVVWNAAAQTRLTDDFQAIGRIDNITDASYQEVWGYGTAGISAYVGLRYRFGSQQ